MIISFTTTTEGGGCGSEYSGRIFCSFFPRKLPRCESWSVSELLSRIIYLPCRHLPPPHYCTRLNSPPPPPRPRGRNMYLCVRPLLVCPSLQTVSTVLHIGVQWFWTFFSKSNSFMHFCIGSRIIRPRQQIRVFRIFSFIWRNSYFRVKTYKKCLLRVDIFVSK